MTHEAPIELIRQHPGLAVELLLKVLKARGLEPSDAQLEQAASITGVLAG
jgi:hypothetical protein